MAIGAAVLAMSVGAGAAGAAGGNGGVGSGGGTGGGGGHRTAATEGVFPVQGKHTYGDGLGAGRGHEGQDVLAKCGEPVVAAQPGRVQANKYQSAAGNYVVIDGKGARGHGLHAPRRRSHLREGQRVRAGERIGAVGDTGDATACHLHFEIWSNPGWYEGGSPEDPAPRLHRWDRHN